METFLVNQPAAGFLPHTPPMLMVRTLLEVSEDSAVCETRVDEAMLPLLDESGALAAHFLAEVMAQTVGAWAGYWDSARDLKPQTGMLVACRTFTCATPDVPYGTCLRAVATKLMQDSTTGSFEVRVFIREESAAGASVADAAPAPLATATLTTHKTTWEHLDSILNRRHL